MNYMAYVWLMRTRAGTVLQWAFWLCFSGLVAACQRPAPVVDLDHISDQFLLLNENGDAAPQRTGPDGRSPFGALLGIVQTSRTSGADSLCAVTHVAPGWAVTATHCLSPLAQGRGFLYLFYYDRSGTFRVTSPTLTWISPNRKNLDVAWIRLDEEQKLNWDTWTDSREEFETGPPKQESELAFVAEVEAFDPMSKADLSARNGVLPYLWGMKPARKRCIGTREFPTLETTSESGEKINHLDGEGLSLGRFHYFECSTPWKAGNSGALISAYDDSGKRIPIGVASALYVHKKEEVAPMFSFRGPSGERPVPLEELREKILFTIGADLHWSKRDPSEAHIDPLVAMRFDTLSGAWEISGWEKSQIKNSSYSGAFWGALEDFFLPIFKQ